MVILSSSTFGIFNIFYRNQKKKETAVILKHIDQLPQNLARVHNVVGSFDRNHKIWNFSNLPIIFIVFIVCLLSAFCSNFDTPLEVQDVHWWKNLCQPINYSLLACYMWKQN